MNDAVQRRARQTIEAGMSAQLFDYRREQTIVRVVIDLLVSPREPGVIIGFVGNVNRDKSFDFYDVENERELTITFVELLDVRIATRRRIDLNALPTPSADP